MSTSTRIVAAAAALAVSGLVLAGGAAPAEAAKPKTYANCTALNKAYPHGVGRKGAQDKVRGSSKKVTNFRVDTALYQANVKSDRDRDGIACEKR